MSRERDVSKDRRASAYVAAASPCGDFGGSVTEEMVSKVAAVLADYFECSPGAAKALAEDVLHTALSSKNDEAQNEAIGSLARGTRAATSFKVLVVNPLVSASDLISI